ncbi:MAG: DUF2127 domain-containing protein [Acidithiobacillales bacterium]
MSAGEVAPKSDVGLRVIVGYKLVKSATEVLAGISLLLLPTRDMEAAVRDISIEIGEHATEAWSHALASLLARATTPTHLELIAAALVSDGFLSAVEGWTLRHRYRWGRWLVIVATSALLPFELVELARRLSPVRIVTLLVNVVVVVYLVTRKTTNAPGAGHDG